MDLKGMEGLVNFSQLASPDSPPPQAQKQEETEYAEPLTQRLNQFRLKGIGCDVLFLVGDEELQILAHKLVLGCSSVVFNAMFYGALSGCCQQYERVNAHEPEAHDGDSDSLVDSVSSGSECLSTSMSSAQDDPLDGEEETRKGRARYETAQSSPGPKPNIIAAKYGNVEVVRVPDIAPIAFNIMLDYIYSNFDVKKVELTEDNVMHTLYAAKKYDIQPLVSACVRYLLNGLSPANAVCLLAQARLFQEESLMQACLDAIDRNTDVALHAQNIADVDHDTLMEVLGRSQLDPSSELVIFEAARSWAEAECERREIMPTVDNLRECLGPALRTVRFPLMNVNEFGHAASSSLLTCEEIAEVFLHLTVKPRPMCRYPTGFRCSSRSKHMVSRFPAISSKRCNRRESKICFTTDRDVFISGLGIYGIAPVSKAHIYGEEKPAAQWGCQVEIQLATISDPSTYGSSTSSFATNAVFLQGHLGDPNPVLAHFTEPVPCAANVTYVATVKFLSETGVQTFGGKDGQEQITVELPFDESVTFKFQSYRNSYGNDVGSQAEGQIPTLHFFVQWPESP